MGRWTIAGPQRLGLDEPVERLDVRLVSGRLNVVGVDGPARIEVNALGTKPLEVTLTDGTLTVAYEGFRRWPHWTGPFWWFAFGRRRYRADVSIAVPQAAVAHLRLVSGSLIASALRGGATIEVTSGRVTLLGLAGHTRAKVVSGPVEALGVGGDLSLETVSGELVLADSTAARVNAKTVSGSITADLDNPPHDSQIHLETVSGEITARVREDSDLDVELRAVSGRLTSAFPELRPHSTHGRHTAHGTLGTGTGRLSAYATSGSISLLRRPVDSDAEADQ
jgi:hypothetical protein